jgi:hypothetical protein
MMFDNGLGVPKDPAQAEYWYNKACPVPVDGPEQDGATGQGSMTK